MGSQGNVVKRIFVLPLGPVEDDAAGFLAGIVHLNHLSDAVAVDVDFDVTFVEDPRPRSRDRRNARGCELFLAISCRAVPFRCLADFFHLVARIAHLDQIGSGLSGAVILEPCLVASLGVGVDAIVVRRDALQLDAAVIFGPPILTSWTT